MKFKVGNRVKCINAVDDNRKVLNAFGTITEIRDGFLNHRICVEFDKKISKDDVNSSWKGKNRHKWICDPEDLELVNDSKNTIVIYQKGNEVIALDKRTGKKAVAKCCPSDTFDFDIGAKLAFERLTRNVTFRVLCIKDCFNLFDIKVMSKGKVYEFIDGFATYDSGDHSLYYSNFEHYKRECRYEKYCVELKDGDDPAEILKMYDTIKEGDKVKVVNNGYTYSTYESWIERNIKFPARRYMWDFDKNPSNGKKGKVIKIAQHSTNDERILAYVEIDGRCYIIGVEGLEKC